MSKILTSTRRAWIYRVALAVIVVAGVYGLVDDAQAAAWVALAAAVLSGGVAAAHTPTSEP